MVKEADIATYEFGMVARIISSPGYVSFMQNINEYAAGAKDIDWNRLLGKYMLDKLWRDMRVSTMLSNTGSFAFRCLCHSE